MTLSPQSLYNKVAARIDPVSKDGFVPAWDRNLDSDTMHAVEQILTHYETSDIPPPEFKMTGNIVQLSLGIAQTLSPTLPINLQAAGKKLVAHLSIWLADYAQSTGSNHLSLEINMNAARRGL